MTCNEMRLLAVVLIRSIILRLFPTTSKVTSKHCFIGILLACIRVYHMSKKKINHFKVQTFLICMSKCQQRTELNKAATFEFCNKIMVVVFFCWMSIVSCKTSPKMADVCTKAVKNKQEKAVHSFHMSSVTQTLLFYHRLLNRASGRSHKTWQIHLLLSILVFRY